MEGFLIKSMSLWLDSEYKDLMWISMYVDSES